MRRWHPTSANRNLTLPTSQDRFSADPVNGDMLRNGTLAQQPTEEEMATYQTLKAQLTLIIKALPPYIVARLNSDKLEELNVSTKLEIRTIEYKGVMEEDESAARARQQQQQATSLQSAPASGSRSQPHRTPGVSGVPYPGHHQYGHQYATPSRTPIPNPQPYYQQTPPRPQPAPIHQRPLPAAVPSVPHTQPRHAQPQPYRPANGYPGYTPQLAKAPSAPYSHASMQYAGSPSQPRAAQHPGYGHGAQAPPPAPYRYSQAYPQGYGQQQQSSMAAQQHHTPQHHASQHHAQQHHAQPAATYPNGAHVATRPMPPPVPSQHSPYSPAAQGQQPRPPYATHATPVLPPATAQRHYSSGSQGPPSGGQTPNPMSFATVMDQPQLQRVLGPGEGSHVGARAHPRASATRSPRAAWARYRAWPASGWAGT